MFDSSSSSNILITFVQVLNAIDDGEEGPLSLIAKWGSSGTRALYAGICKTRRTYIIVPECPKRFT